MSSEYQGYLKVDIFCIQKFGLNAAVLLAELLSVQSYWAQRGKLDEDGMFFETRDMIEKRTSLSKHQQEQAISLLKAAGVIKVKRKGMPAKNCFSVQSDRLSQLVKNSPSSWSEINQQVGQKLTNKLVKNSPSSWSEINQQVGQKLDSNKIITTNSNNKIITIRSENKEPRPSPAINRYEGDPIDRADISLPVKDKIEEFLTHRVEMNKPMTPTGLNNMLRAAEECERKHGAVATINAINASLSNGYAGIYWDKAAEKNKPGKYDYAEQMMNW